jgi:hypothetical protein
MATGLSGSYAINGTELSIQPTTGRWMPQSVVGINGNGIPIYPRVREFELRWNLSDPALVNTLRTYFNALQFTGTVALDLPQLESADYRFYRYSGCSLYQPERGAYFAEHITDLVMIVGNIT